MQINTYFVIQLNREVIIWLNLDNVFVLIIGYYEPWVLNNFFIRKSGPPCSDNELFLKE